MQNLYLRIYVSSPLVKAKEKEADDEKGGAIVRKNIVSFNSTNRWVSNGAAVFGYGSVVDTRVLRRAPIYMYTYIVQP